MKILIVAGVLRSVYAAHIPLIKNVTVYIRGIALYIIWIIHKLLIKKKKKNYYTEYFTEVPVTRIYSGSRMQNIYGGGNIAK